VTLGFSHRPKFDARFRLQFFVPDARRLTSLTAFGTSLSYGADFWSQFLERVSGALQHTRLDKENFALHDVRKRT